MTGQLPLTVMVTNFDQTLKTAKLKSGEMERQRQKEEEKRKRQKELFSFLLSLSFLYLPLILIHISLFILLSVPPISLSLFPHIESCVLVCVCDGGKSEKKETC